MEQKSQLVSFGHLHLLIGTADEELLDGLIGGLVLDTDKTLCRISHWQINRKARYLRLGAVGKSLQINSQELIDKDLGQIELKLNDKSLQLLDACNRAALAKAEKERLQEVAEYQAKLLAIEQASLLQREQRKAIQKYRDCVLQIAISDREHLMDLLRELIPVLPFGYVPSIESLAGAATEWLECDSLPKAPSGSEQIFKIEPFLGRTWQLWKSDDPWDQIRLIRHFTDQSFCLEALDYSFQLESGEYDTDRLRGISTSRIRTLSLSGLGLEAEQLGMEISAGLENLDCKLAYAMMGVYSRSPELDPNKSSQYKLKQWLQNNTCTSEPSDTKVSIKIDEETRAKMRRTLNDHHLGPV